MIGSNYKADNNELFQAVINNDLDNFKSILADPNKRQALLTGSVAIEGEWFATLSGNRGQKNVPVEWDKESTTALHLIAISNPRKAVAMMEELFKYEEARELLFSKDSVGIPRVISDDAQYVNHGFIIKIPSKEAYDVLMKVEDAKVLDAIYNNSEFQYRLSQDSNLIGHFIKNAVNMGNKDLLMRMMEERRHDFRADGPFLSSIENKNQFRTMMKDEAFRKKFFEVTGESLVKECVRRDLVPVLDVISEYPEGRALYQRKDSEGKKPQDYTRSKDMKKFFTREKKEENLAYNKVRKELEKEFKEMYKGKTPKQLEAQSDVLNKVGIDSELFKKGYMKSQLSNYKLSKTDKLRRILTRKAVTDIKIEKMSKDLAKLYIQRQGRSQIHEIATSGGKGR